MGVVRDLLHKRFGRLTVVAFAGNGGIGKQGKGAARWVCKCDCGHEKTILGASLTSKKTKSCGCLNREIRLVSSKTHGCTKTATYKSWSHMKARCLNPKNHDFMHYGARGIKVCDRWLHSFENFLSDMGEKPKGRTLGRIDNDKGYSPKNTQWETQKEQTRNMRRNWIITYHDESRCLADWAKHLNIGRSTLAYRLKHHDTKTAFNMALWSKPQEKAEAL